VNRKELSVVIAECAEVTQRAAARTERARAGVEVARRRQEEAAAEQRTLTTMLEKRWAEADARWEKEQVAMREAATRSEKMLQAVIAELRDQRDERRALIEALLRLTDRLD
jgi:cytochrome P450